MADFRDQLRVVKQGLAKPKTRVVFSQPVTDTGKTVQYFPDDDAMLQWISKYVPQDKWNFKVFHKMGQWAWKEVLNHHEKENKS